MVFRRKKKDQTHHQPPAMRGRHSIDSGSAADKDPGQNPLARRFMDDDEPDTVDLEEPARFRETADGGQQETTTRLLAGESDRMDSPEDPVTGFLVVISGPGKGSVCSLGYGMNPVGRESSQRVCLDFGDPGISRVNHCLVTFEPLSARFYIQPGEGRNLAYLDGEPVLAPTTLNNGQHIRVGDTVLRFVAFCGEDFSWESKD